MKFVEFVAICYVNKAAKAAAMAVESFAQIIATVQLFLVLNAKIVMQIAIAMEMEIVAADLIYTLSSRGNILAGMFLMND